jgi:hypothetical protein
MADDNVALTIGALRQRALAARQTLDTNARHEREAAQADLEFVFTMALIQIAQEANEIKNILATPKLTTDERKALLWATRHPRDDEPFDHTQEWSYTAFVDILNSAREKLS